MRERERIYADRAEADARWLAKSAFRERSPGDEPRALQVSPKGGSGISVAFILTGAALTFVGFVMIALFSEGSTVPPLAWSLALAFIAPGLVLAAAGMRFRTGRLLR